MSWRYLHYHRHLQGLQRVKFQSSTGVSEQCCLTERLLGHFWMHTLATIRPESVKATRKHLIENLQMVLNDNERSMCMHDKTCAGKWKNSQRDVHVIHTSLRDPNLVNLLHRVSLSSMTRQTSYGLLWIIRVADSTYYRLVLAFMNPIRNSLFKYNILLVKSETAPAVDFRSVDAIADISKETILHGDIALLND
jgi:hypothetical protein